jgi:hypothetical protein
MAKPKQTPVLRPAPSSPSEFSRDYDFETQATGPRELAELLESTGTEIVTPDPQKES